MQLELDFVQHEVHKNILLGIAETLCTNEEVIGILLVGSVARGDAYKESDLDIYVLLKDGAKMDFQVAVKNGIMVEYKYSDYEKAINKIQNNSMEVYNYLDGKILYDKLGVLKKLTETAKVYYNSYNISANEKREISHWLKSTVIKVKAATNNEDISKALFIITTSSWEMLKGVWSVNNIPVPPAAAIKEHLNNLCDIAVFDKGWFDKLFSGSADERIDTAIKLSEWVIQELCEIV